MGATFQDGNGTATHLGRFTATANLLCHGAPSMTGDIPVLGTVVLRAADGSELHTMYSGVLNISGSGIADYVFVGGTGRFQGAGGTGRIFAYFDVSSGLQNVHMTTRWVGTVIY